VAALFPEHFHSFTMAFPFAFLNNSFGTHFFSYIQKHNRNIPGNMSQQKDLIQKKAVMGSFDRDTLAKAC
jgi:hypothetical protein